MADKVYTGKEIKITAQHNFTLYPKGVVLGDINNKKNWGVVKWDIVNVIDGEEYVRDDDSIIIVGDYNSLIKPKTDYTIKAREVDNPTRGLQYEVDMISEMVDLNNTQNQKRFLSSILTERQIEEIYKVFPNPISILKNEEVDKLTKVKGIGESTAIKIFEKFRENEDKGIIYVELGEYDFSPKLINKLVKTYNSPQKVVEIIKENPYKLIEDVDGIGFTKADEIALKVGLDMKSPKRIEGYILHYLETQAQEGNSFVYSSKLNQAIYEQFGGKENIRKVYYDKDGNPTGNNITIAFNSLIERKMISMDDPTGEKAFRRVYLRKYYYLENKISTELHRLLNAPNKFEYELWEEVLKEQEAKQGWNFTDEQKQGIKLGLDEQVCLITGGAGCVDRDTEFYNGTEWKPICEYQQGEHVMQYNEDGTTSLVVPKKYVKRETYEQLYHLSTASGVDMCVSMSHDVVWFNENGDMFKRPMQEFINAVKGEDTVYIKTLDGELMEVPSYTPIVPYNPVDGMEYCFVVDSHMLVLKRDGNPFITGNCGKSSLVSGIVEALKRYSLAQCALSGRASARLQEVTGQEGQTIHRLLGYSPMNGGDGFGFNSENQLPCEIIILDEISLVGGDIFLSLVRAIATGSKFIILGDMGQLESIGCMNLAHDLYVSKCIPTVELTKTHRQAEKSGIITTAKKVRNSEQIFGSSFEGEMVLGELQDMYFQVLRERVAIDEDEDDGFWDEDEIVRGKQLSIRETVFERFKHWYDSEWVNDIMDIQILCPVKDRGDSSIFYINSDIQELLNPDSPFKSAIEVNYKDDKKFYLRENDKVMCVTNIYDLKNLNFEDTPVYNGWIGIIKKIMPQYDEVHVYFPIIDDTIIFKTDIAKESIILSYGSTVHKYQGSSARVVIGVLDNCTPPKMLTKELAYTLITRAEKICDFVVQNSAFRKAVISSGVKNKNTFLVELLDGYAHD